MATDPDLRTKPRRAALGLVPRRYQSGEADDTRSISKCGDRRVRILLYKAANVMLTRYHGPLKLKRRGLAIAMRGEKLQSRHRAGHGVRRYSWEAIGPGCAPHCLRAA
jgi:transposase